MIRKPKLLFTFIITVFIPMLSSVQAQTFEWARAMGGSGTAVVTDLSGNVYTTGTFRGTVDFDPGPGVFNLTSAGVDDVYVSKLDSAGKFNWALRVGGTSIDYARSITIDAFGYLYYAGVFMDNVDFNPGPGVFNLDLGLGYNMFISKLDTSGNFIWAKAMGGPGNDQMQAITTDAAGNVYTTGWFNGVADFDPGPAIYSLSSKGSPPDMFISKLNSSGNFVWAKAFGDSSSSQAYDILTDASGSIYVTGLFMDSVDFDPGVGVYNLFSSGGNDIFIAKFNASGDLEWAKAMGGVGNDLGRTLNLDATGNIYVAGNFSATSDFDPGIGVYNLTSAGNDDVFISRLDKNGNFVWAKGLGGSGLDQVFSITTDALGSVYATGAFSETVDFDPGLAEFYVTARGVRDVFAIKLDSSGNLNWINTIGSDNNSLADIGHGITTDAFNNIYMTGSFAGKADFDPGPGVYELTPSTNANAYVVKLRSCSPDSFTQIISACETFTWFGNTYTSSGAYIHNIPKVSFSGCDSVFTLQLTINRNNTSNITTSACNSYISPSGKYQWTIAGVYYDTIPNSHGCDSAIKINLTIDTLDLTISKLFDGTHVALQTGAATYQWIDCDSSKLPLKGEVNKQFVARKTGSYAVIIKKGACHDTSACVAIIAGVGQLEGGSANVSIYPNPNNGQFTIEVLGIETTYEITVTDVLGKTILSQKEQSSKSQVDLSGEANGTYFIRIKTEMGVVNRKVIINQ